jgi:hypothetical protein
MKIKLRFVIASSVFFLSACSTEPNNKLPEKNSSQDLEQRVGDLEKEATAGSAVDEDQEQGARLTQQSVSATNEYLAKLYKNINETRAQDLPEWQDMYAALTNSAAMENPDYGLGPRKETTNFQRLHRRSDTTDSAVAVINTRLGEQAAVDTAHAKSLEVILERLATIDRNIQDLNNTVTEKFKSVDKLLTEYDGRITGVENRMKTVEVDLDSFRTEFVGYRQRVTNIETLLRRYDLAVMHNDINVLRDITTNHEERILDLTGKVQINTSEILVTKSNLIEAEQELSGVSAEVGGLKVGVAEIFTRLDNCNCR